MIKIRDYEVESIDSRNIDVNQIRWATCKSDNAFNQKGDVYPVKHLIGHYRSPSDAINGLFRHIQMTEFENYDELSDFVFAMEGIAEEIKECVMGAEI